MSALPEGELPLEASFRTSARPRCAGRDAGSRDAQAGSEGGSSAAGKGLWIKCDGCGEIVYKQDVEKNLEVCPKCDEHFPLPVRRRLELVLDPGSFAEHDIGLESTDPLQFSDSKRYRERIKASQKSANEGEAFISGIGRIAGRDVSIGAFHFGFMGGSMGSVVGEKVTRIFERGTDRRISRILV